MLDEADGDLWVSRRNSRVTRLIESLGFPSGTIPYLAPEVQGRTLTPTLLTSRLLRSVPKSLQLEQLVVWRGETHLSGREVNDRCGLVLDRANSAQAVRVVAYPISHGERLDGLGNGSNVEGTG
jgi:hypothetical protein